MEAVDSTSEHSDSAAPKAPAWVPLHLEQRPTEVVTNEAGSFNVALNHTANALTQQQLAEAHDAIDKMFHNLYPSATWYRSELTTIHGRKTDEQVSLDRAQDG